MRPAINKVPSFYQRYVESVENENIVENLEAGRLDLLSLYESISEQSANYAYAPDKWTIKQILMHLIDTERVMSYRAMRFARKDETALPSFDQDVFVNNTNPDLYKIEDLVAEYKAVRQSTILLFKNMPEANLLYSGTASGHTISVLTLAFIIAGHEKHHLAVIRERYGVVLS